MVGTLVAHRCVNIDIVHIMGPAECGTFAQQTLEGLRIAGWSAERTLRHLHKDNSTVKIVWPILTPVIPDSVPRQHLRLICIWGSMRQLISNLNIIRTILVLIKLSKLINLLKININFIIIITTILQYIILHSWRLAIKILIAKTLRRLSNLRKL